MFHRNLGDQMKVFEDGHLRYFKNGIQGDVIKSSFSEKVEENVH